MELFFKQPIFKNYPEPQMKAYFKSIIDDGQIVTIERNGEIVAFQDYWKINRNTRDILLRMTRDQTTIFLIKGTYPHFQDGGHLYVNYTVVDEEYRNGFMPIKLARKIAEKNPKAKTVVYHRENGKSYLSQVRR